METYTKFADNEMNYYQFKAKQFLLQKKEEKEWQDFCKRVAPECEACFAEKADIKESKDIAIQTFPKKPIQKIDKTSQPNYQNEKIPEALVNIKNRLEKIDQALSKLFDGSHQNEKEQESFCQERSHMALKPVFPSQQAIKTFEEKQKLLIQNSLRTSLQNLQKSGITVHKQSRVSKPRNLSFFLPHDLEVKRAAARRSYLASLQSKPKTSLPNKKQSINEKIKNSQSKKTIPARKSTVLKKGNQTSEGDKEETLVKSLATNDTKDENIETIVDVILEDLLGEAALDLSKIRQAKREKSCNIQTKTCDKSEKSPVLFNPETKLSTKCEDSNFMTNNNSGIMKLKLYIDSSEEIKKEDTLRKELTELSNKSNSTPNIECSKATFDRKASTISKFHKTSEVKKTVPKFVCDIMHIIKIDPEKAENIASNRNKFWNYLECISQTAKGNFNPWVLTESLAESILDDCIQDIAEELNELPIHIIQDLYNQEFVQQVEI